MGHYSIYLVKNESLVSVYCQGFVRTFGNGFRIAFKQTQTLKSSHKNSFGLRVPVLKSDSDLTLLKVEHPPTGKGLYYLYLILLMNT